MFELANQNVAGANIKVVGVGGGGGNALNNMIEAGLEGVEFICANTDAQALNQNLAPNKIRLGGKLTKGLGAGATPEVGRKAALEDQALISEQVTGADMVFVTAGMGGGTGTGAAPVIANIARESGALTVAVVTRPFTFEGSRRCKFADAGLDELRQSVDTLIVIPNDKLLNLAQGNTTLQDAFAIADSVLLNAVRGISDLILIPGLINVDFADVKTIMSEKGHALMGTGTGSGEGRAREAAHTAISSPLLEEGSIQGATGILVNITSGPDLGLQEVSEAIQLINEVAHPDCNIIFGSVINPDMVDTVKITVVATGFENVRPAESDWGYGAGTRRLPTHNSEPAQQQVSPLAEEPVMVHSGGGRRPQAMQAAVAPPLPQPQQQKQHAWEEQTDLDRPTYVRRQGGTTTNRREPVTTNPFATSDQSEFDTPTFLRK